MQTKNTQRALTRLRRQKAIQHAFNVYWHKWGRGDDPYGYYSWWGCEKVYLDNNEDRYAHEDEHRSEVMLTSKMVAKHLRNCSCFMCSGYKKYEKTPWQLRQAAKDLDEFADLCDSFDCAS